MVEYIYYTGVGAKKNGKHSVKEFLDIMNKNFNIKCSEFLTDLDYKPCREYKEMDSKTMAHNIKYNKPYPKDFVFNLEGENDKLQRIGWKQKTDISQGLEKTIEFYKKLQ